MSCRLSRAASVVLLGAACVLLGACASSPPVGSGPRDEPYISPEARAGALVKKRSYVLKRGGGYYKDDGPGDNAPEDLDLVPDAQPRLEPLHRFANRPYAVFGREYQPETRLTPYRDRGVASWYGRKFHGARTSSGEPYDMYAMTAAHPTRPIPSYLRVTNVENGRSVVVRVNDRGPFHSDRLIDLSYTAAYRLGYVDQGSAQVELESLIPDEGSVMIANAVVADEFATPPLGRGTTTPATIDNRADPIAAIAQSAALPDRGLAAAAEPARGAYVQLGAFENRDNAESFGARIKRELSWAADRVVVLAQGGHFKLHLGPYTSANEATQVAERLAQSIGTKPFVIMR